ncbi:MAG: hypothetical protein Q7I97_01620, partial [Thermovirgaceae bacterium]|nr:hypothetical protein [Thermovirgaceae bacterium]
HLVNRTLPLRSGHLVTRTLPLRSGHLVTRTLPLRSGHLVTRKSVVEEQVFVIPTKASGEIWF